MQSVIDNLNKIYRRESKKYSTAYCNFGRNVRFRSTFRMRRNFRKFKTKGNNVSRATLYRTMDILVKYSFIRKLDIGDGRIRYERKIGTSHHDHMICIDTGDIIGFCSDEIENLQNEIAEKHGYKLIRHVHQLFVKKI